MRNNYTPVLRGIYLSGSPPLSLYDLHHCARPCVILAWPCPRSHTLVEFLCFIIKIDDI